MRRAKCGGGGCELLCAERDAVVSQRPGRGGHSGDERTEMEVGMGICSENRSAGLRVKWAMRDVAMWVYRIETARARGH
jgi:hypothetical protein